MGNYTGSGFCYNTTRATNSQSIGSDCFCLDVFEYVRLRSPLSPEYFSDMSQPAGFIHLFFEAYFVVNHETIASSQELFGQLWKEYSLSDSRYLTSDAFVVCMEAVTAVSPCLVYASEYILNRQFAWGFLAFYIAYCIAVQHPARYALQLIISVGQVYGDVLYYATSLLDVSYCRPEGYYFWFYYFFFNFIWMVVGCCEYCFRLHTETVTDCIDQIISSKVSWRSQGLSVDLRRAMLCKKGNKYVVGIIMIGKE